MSQKTTTPGQDRTADLRFRKPSLYPLSYGGEEQKTLKNKGFRRRILRAREQGNKDSPNPRQTRPAEDAPLEPALRRWIGDGSSADIAFCGGVPARTMTHSCEGSTFLLRGSAVEYACIRSARLNNVPCETGRKACLASEPLQGIRCYLRRDSVDEMSVTCGASRNNIAAGRRAKARRPDLMRSSRRRTQHGKGISFDSGR